MTFSPDEIALMRQADLGRLAAVRPTAHLRSVPWASRTTGSACAVWRSEGTAVPAVAPAARGAAGDEVDTAIIRIIPQSDHQFRHRRLRYGSAPARCGQSRRVRRTESHSLYQQNVNRSPSVEQLPGRDLPHLGNEVRSRRSSMDM